MSEFTIVSPAGFQAAGVSCGIKTVAGRLDLGLLVADRPVSAAAIFTTNKVVAAPVILDRRIIKKGRLRAIVVNSGNANACTGDQGMKDAREMASRVAKAIGCRADEVLVSSTGIIGHLLPMAKIRSGIADAAGQLGSTAERGTSFAQAIMTTDKQMKFAAARGQVGGVAVTVCGTCKGAGMISPNMATMLAYLTTDANVASSALASALKAAAAESFNAVTVDGHTSTNDTLAIMASGAAGGAEIGEASAEYAALLALLKKVCLELSLQIVADGEGATRVIEVRVEGGRHDKDAGSAARAIANSPLLKCAVNGGDPNWGRVVSAAGYCGAKVDQTKMRLWIGEELVFDAGTPTQFDRAKCEAHMRTSRVLLRLDLGQGDGRAVCYGCDLSKEYVTINADYHT